MLPLFQQELSRLGWITPEQFTDIVSVAQMTPGAVSLNTATYVGSLQAGLLGAFAATLGLILPGFCLSIIILKTVKVLKTNMYMERAIRGIRAAAIGLIGSAVLFFMERSMILFSEPSDSLSIATESKLLQNLYAWINHWAGASPLWIGIIIGVVACILSYKKKLSPFLAIPIAFVLGVLVL